MLTGPQPSWLLLALALARLMATLAGLITTTMLARGLGPTTYGEFAMLLALQAQALLFAELGLRQVVTADCGYDPAAVRSWLGRYFSLRLALAGSTMILALPVALWLVPASAMASTLLLSTLVASALLCDWLALARGRPLEAVLPLVTRPLLMALAVCAVTLAGLPLSLELAAALVALSWWAAALISLPSLRLLPRPSGSVPPFAALLRRAAMLGIGGLAAQALLSLDILLIGSLLSPTAAGHYQIAAAVLTAGLIFANAASQLMLARSGKLRDRLQEPQSELLGELALILVLGVVLAMVAAAMAPLLLPWLLGEAYAPSVSLLLWLLPWFCLQHPASSLQATLIGLAREGAVLKANLLGLVSALLLYLVGSWLGAVQLFAIGRGAGESVRIITMLCALAPSAAAPAAASAIRARAARGCDWFFSRAASASRTSPADGAPQATAPSAATR